MNKATVPAKAGIDKIDPRIKSGGQTKTDIRTITLQARARNAKSLGMHPEAVSMAGYHYSLPQPLLPFISEWFTAYDSGNKLEMRAAYLHLIQFLRNQNALQNVKE